MVLCKQNASGCNMGRERKSNTLGCRIMGMFERRAVDPHFLQFALNFFFDVL